MKNTSDKSLRRQVEKWLAPALAAPVHVTEFGRTRRGGTRYVRVETSSPTGLRVLFFFRHDDGTWYVFPPATERRKLAVVEQMSFSCETKPIEPMDLSRRGAVIDDFVA